MIDNRSLVDLIERAQDVRPYCPCGRHTTPVWRDGAVWLECSLVLEPSGSRLRRALAALAAPAHTHVHIVDVPAAPTEAVGATAG